MYAIEFKTKIKNGIIKVPVEYKDKLKDHVKVIILKNEKKSKSNMVDQLLNSPLKIKNFTPFSRDEIYDQTRK